MIDHDKWDSLTENVKSYVNTQIELTKLQATDKLSIAGSAVFSSVFLLLTVISSIFFLSFWLALYLSKVIGDTYSGFAVVGGVYLLLSVLLFAARKQILTVPIRNQIIKVMYKKED